MRIRQHKGFTLIELMITVAIVAILASVAYPSFIEQIVKGKRSECRSGALQTMQQQERYFSQYNTYVESKAPPKTAKVKNFSGDSPENSACYIESKDCSDTRKVDQCVEVISTPKFTDPKKVNYFYVDSDGVRGCSINGTRTTTDKLCW